MGPSYPALPAASNTSDYVHLLVWLSIPIQKVMERDLLHISTIGTANPSHAETAAKSHVTLKSEQAWSRRNEVGQNQYLN